MATAQPMLVDIPATGGPVDPYLLWGLKTDFRAFKRRQKKAAETLNFLVELDHGYRPGIDFATLGTLKNCQGACSILLHVPADIGPVRAVLQIPDAYGRPLPHNGGATAHFLSLRLGGQLNAACARWVVDLLMGLGGIRRLQVGFQRPPLDHSEDCLQPECRDPAAGVAGITAMASVPAVVLGVVEDACPFGHASLLQAGQTRVVSLWNQSLVPAIQAPWAPVPGFPYGRQLDQAAMNALLADHTSGGFVDEDALLADPKLAMWELRRNASHAAAVIDLFTGPTPLLGRGEQQDCVWPPVQVPHLAESQWGDGADTPNPVRSAPLLVVQLPREQTSISSGRWLAINALDALHHLIGSAQALAGGQAPPLVVNLSYGAIAGPHDGSSMLESAIDELCAGYHNLAVVLAAGNTHGVLHDTDAADPHTCLPSGVHAQRRLDPGAERVFRLVAPADKPFETYLELWFSDPGLAADADQHLALDEVQIVVTDPTGRAWPAVRCGQAWYACDAAGQVLAGLVFAPRPSQSLHRSMALLVLAATRVHEEFPETLAGTWTVSLRHVPAADSRPLLVDAWVERDESTYAIDRAQSARLLPDGPLGHAPLSDANTFSNLANSRHALVVGALTQRPPDASGCRRASPYSAAGASPTQGPLLSATADAGAALSGIRVRGSRSGLLLRADGTSLAAPQAARWIAYSLAKGATLETIRASLQAEAACRDARRGVQVP